MKSHIYTILIGLVIFTTSCNNEEQNVNISTQQEVSTTLTLKFTNLADTNKKNSFTFRTNDGAVFGRDAKLDTVVLHKGETYRMEVLVLDESKQTPLNVTDEINLLSSDHQFFFSTNPSDLINFVISKFNKDEGGLILGTKVDSLVVGRSLDIGSLRVILRHRPNKAGLRVNRNDTTYAGGETDIAVTFPIQLK